MKSRHDLSTEAVLAIRKSADAVLALRKNVEPGRTYMISYLTNLRDKLEESADRLQRTCDEESGA